LNALIFAKNIGCDVYNCLNVMENAAVFEDLHFLKGDGHLSYYLYNWVMKIKHIKPEELAIVLF
jgi:glycylpeptide N-tetradecanoyltransferase